MSGYAHQWAKRQRVGDSSAKTLLKTYANWASEDYSTWVTNEELELDTELNIQTIRRARNKLIELGYLLETDKRIGRTQSIVVYQMLAPAGASIVQSVDQRTGETISLSPPTLEEFMAKRGGKRSPSKSQPSKGDEISSPSKIQAATDSTSSPSKSHVEGGEISPEAPPNFDTKMALVVQEKAGDQQPARRAPRVALHGQILNLELPDWLPFDSWDAWCEHREAKAKDAPWTLAAAKVSIKRIKKLLDVGQSVETTIDEAVLRGWTGLFPVRDAQQQGGATGAAAAPADWWKSESGYLARGQQLGVDRSKFQFFEQFKAKVCKLAGPGEWMEELLRTVSRESEERYEALYAYFNEIPRDKPALAAAA
ncbi:helix-turn-helix domain-containing protein [Paraburkholderia sp. CNPSo 3272]|uniref:helix-turn-helix domain-containing protein n=1 Tax=Paraburkholderia sp. CNPSo 3272 TaxID=2940931 RepID=UPI0020B69AA2|nr:helix-turn-helix domain-containing protein [Paraburkholderia sp. CNPSo 3272]MCP3721752.1 helix-turn-helix domain-containing protein [Paraburkholderia sp. CNPSo 3272]